MRDEVRRELEEVSVWRGLRAPRAWCRGRLGVEVRGPGCRNATCLDVHDIRARARAEGGLHVARNLIVLCGVHHRAVHAGTLIIDGPSALAARFRTPMAPRRGGARARAELRALEAHAKVFSALRHLGFRETAARAMLDELCQPPGSESLGADGLLRAALERTRPGSGVTPSVSEARFATV